MYKLTSSDKLLPSELIRYSFMLARSKERVYLISITVCFSCQLLYKIIHTAEYILIKNSYQNNCFIKTLSASMQGMEGTINLRLNILSRILVLNRDSTINLN